ncbi:MAG: hypothetical protein NTX91_00045 [candidate division SR1 bacterium]|nr:hypothetical protein [candidate division SR1 bacterium]
MKKTIIFIGFDPKNFWPYEQVIVIESKHNIICCNFPTIESAIAAMQGEDVLELVIAFVILNGDDKTQTIEVIDEIKNALPADNAETFAELPKLIFSHENIQKELLDRKCISMLSMESAPEELWDVVKQL